MIALVLSTTALALAAFSWWLSECKVKNLTKRIGELKKSEQLWKYNCIDLNERLASLTDAHDCKYMPIYTNNGEVRVYKVVTFRERNYHIIIKTFTDADANYNRLRAEELLEKLNEE